VSLATLDPLAFITLKETGRCERVTIPESLFDLDTPGHYLRRLKRVSVTIPCVTGPYTGVHCKLRLLNNEIRWDRSAPGTAQDYPRNPSGDSRFIVDRRILEAITTSSAQNDSGLLETGFQDQQYLPFEGAGAVSTWSLELPDDFRTFDYNTISDVILHLQYTARDGGDALKEKAEETTKALIGEGLLSRGATASEEAAGPAREPSP
jgi:receptor-binding and translocation channel-forming TcA subunit of Tc toxin